MRVEHPSHLMRFTHKKHVYDWEVDSKQLPHWAVLLRDGEFEHLPVCAKELVCVIFYRIEVVVKT